MLVEKPITTTLEEADALLAIARRTGAVLQTGHVERFNRAVRAALELVDGPRFIESNRLAPFNPRGSDVAVVLDLMIHDIDLVRTFVGGGVSSVSAVGVPVLTPFVDIANARITFEAGAVANITASRVSRERMRKLRIFQESGYLSLDLAAGTGEFYRLRKDVDLAALVRDAQGAQALESFVERIPVSGTGRRAAAPGARGVRPGRRRRGAGRRHGRRRPRSARRRADHRARHRANAARALGSPNGHEPCVRFCSSPERRPATCTRRASRASSYARGAPYTLTGIGGDQMKAAGVELIEHTGNLAVMGFVEVLEYIPKHLALLRELKTRLQERQRRRRRAHRLSRLQHARRGGERRDRRSRAVLHHAAGVGVAHGSRREARANGHESRGHSAVRGEAPSQGTASTRRSSDIRCSTAPRRCRTARRRERRSALSPDDRVLALFPGSRKQEIEHLLDAFVAVARELERRVPGPQAHRRRGAAHHARRRTMPVPDGAIVVVHRAARGRCRAVQERHDDARGGGGRMSAWPWRIA